MTKKYVKTFRVDNIGNKRIESLMEKLDMNLSDTINKLIADTIKGESFTVELEICPLRVNLEDGYFCSQTPVKPQKLGNGSKKDADALCEKCQYFKKLMAEYEQLKGEPWRTKVPYCAHEESSNLPEDNSILEKLFSISVTNNYKGGKFECGLNPDSIKECQVKNRGKECRYLKWFEIQSEEISNMVKEWCQIK